MSDITYIKGDLFNLYEKTGDKTAYKHIPHIVNDEGKWGSGFVVAVSKQWPIKKMAANKSHFACPEFVYRSTCLHRARKGKTPRLGFAQQVVIDTNLSVWNMFAQHGIKPKVKRPIRYTALSKCLLEIADYIKERADKPHEIHAPKFGSDRAGGDWSLIEKLIEEAWVDNDIPVYIYEL